MSRDVVSRRFVRSLIDRKIGRRVDFPATYAIERALRAPGDAFPRRRGWSERRTGSVKDRPEPCRPSGARSSSSSSSSSFPRFTVLFFFLLFFFRLYTFICCSLVVDVTAPVSPKFSQRRSFGASHSAVPYGGTPRGIRAIPILAVPRPNQRLRRLETGRPYKSAAARAVEAERAERGGRRRD